MTDTARVTIHMVASLDFFIAKPDNSIAWLQSSDNFDKGVSMTDEDAAAFVSAIDCYVMGSRTYEHALALGWPYGEVPTIVLTHRALPRNRDSVEFYAGDLHPLVKGRLAPRYKNIWVVGGAALAKDFIRAKLADDIRIAIMPILIGGGTPFVDHIGQEQPLHLRDVTAYKDGMVELWYEVRK